MRVAVIGAGAIGAVLAEAATAAGHEVVLAVRTPVDGLVVEHHPEGPEVRVAVTVVSDLAAAGGPVRGASGVGPVDVVFLTVKATDTAAAAGWMGRWASPAVPVVAVQNGLDHADRLAPHVPAGTPVFAGLAYVAAERLEAGRVRHLAGDLLIVPAAAAELVTAAVGGPGGMRVRGADDMVTESWRKLLGNLVANPLTALTMRRIDVMGEPGIADLARGVLAEAVAVGRAAGADLDESEIERVVEGTGRYGPATGSSMLYDRLAGRPLEHQYLTGEVVRRGRALGVPTPLNSALLALLEATDRGRPGA